MLASLIAGERLPQVAGPERPSASADRDGRVRADGRGAAASCAGPKAPSAITTATTRCSTTIPVFDVRQIAHRQRRDLSGDRRRQAAPGGLLHRRSAAGAAVAALPAGDAGGRAAVVVRRDRLSLAGRRRRQAALQARSDGQRLPHPRRRAAVADEVPAPDRSASGSEGLPCHAGARAGAHRSADRPLRVLEPVDGHARLHRAGRQRRLEGRVARARRSGPRAAARSSRRRCRRRRT